MAYGRHQTEVVQGGRPQAVNQAPDVGDCLLALLFEPGQQLFGGRLLGDHAAGGVEPDGEGAERGPQAVVQIPPEAPPLLLARRNQPLPRAPQVGREARGVGGRARLMRQVVEQPPVGRGECLPWSPRCHNQLSYLFRVVHERQDHGFARGTTVLGRRYELAVLPEGDCCVGQLQRLVTVSTMVESASSGASVPSRRLPRRDRTT
jgi:hypothetical protein